MKDDFFETLKDVSEPNIWLLKFSLEEHVITRIEYDSNLEDDQVILRDPMYVFFAPGPDGQYILTLRPYVVSEWVKSTSTIISKYSVAMFSPSDKLIEYYQDVLVKFGATKVDEKWSNRTKEEKQKEPTKTIKDKILQESGDNILKVDFKKKDKKLKMTSDIDPESDPDPIVS